ncbi:MAG: polysaccharide biosynthesis C-terminal domain-containing protein, partial [Oscillospiraceae bacterium]|nr:polysaccharide biosynthesis C-terminal domain-containing protein [Oscillospiraceae bacterium]
NSRFGQILICRHDVSKQIFIYLEIVLEGIIKGLGRQNFSTLNSLCEYIIRILCVVIFVRLYGFAGVLISYYASNIYSNIVRIIFVCRVTGVRFSVFEFLAKPFIMCFFCCQISSAATRFISFSSILFETVIYLCTAAVSFIILYELDRYFCKGKTSAKNKMTAAFNKI